MRWAPSSEHDDQLAPRFAGLNSMKNRRPQSALQTFAAVGPKRIIGTGSMPIGGMLLVSFLCLLSLACGAEEYDPQTQQSGALGGERPDVLVVLTESHVASSYFGMAESEPQHGFLVQDGVVFDAAYARFESLESSLMDMEYMGGRIGQDTWMARLKNAGYRFGPSQPSGLRAFFEEPSESPGVKTVGQLKGRLVF